MIDWSKIDPADHGQIVTIASRAKSAIPALFDVDKLTIIMDLSAAHLDVGLDLQALADADEATFAHDVAGIVRHMDREEGKLGDCFLPRTARK